MKTLRELKAHFVDRARIWWNPQTTGTGVSTQLAQGILSATQGSFIPVSGGNAYQTTYGTFPQAMPTPTYSAEYTEMWQAMQDYKDPVVRNTTVGALLVKYPEVSADELFAVFDAGYTAGRVESALRRLFPDEEGPKDQVPGVVP